jgi:uncharacterized protein (TIGR02145 family)
MRFFCLLLLFLPTLLFSQVPQGVGYQAVATDLNGVELINQTISIQASVLSSSVTGNVEWQEEHSVTTDAFGLFTLTIGQGTSTGNGTQANFADISWGSATHFLKIEMDVNGGTNYSHMGTNQMMSVPYALYAENANINYDSIATILSNDSSFTNSISSGGSSAGSGNMIVSNFGDTLTLNGQTIIIPGISYSNYVPNYGSLTDIDGNTYQTVLIYGKEWMSEDLLVTKFSNGDAINQITGTNSSSHPNCTSPSYAYETSGSLGPKVWYNGYVVQDSRNVCPTGWHVPTETEYSDLFDLFSDRDTVPPAQQGNGYIYYWEDAGSKLKKPNSGWNTTSNYPFGQATNDSYLGFESYPEPGCTNFSNFYFTTGANRKVYTGTPAPVNGGNYHIQIRDVVDRVDIHDTPSYYLYSVRCVKD